MLVKTREQRVVVARGDRVELVVVAAGAAERQARGTPGRRVSIWSSTMSSTIFGLSGSASTFGPEREEAGGDQPVVRARRRDSSRQQVAGELLADEAVVRLVGVERA